MSPTPEEIKLLELAARHAIAEEGSDTGRREQERGAGKLSGRERIEVLLDKGTFEETGKFVTHRATDITLASERPPGDGVITGYGLIHGRVVCVFAQDAAVFGGTLAEANSAKVVALIQTAMRIGAPVIGLHDSVGVRIQEGVPALAGATDVLFHQSLASGVVPQISAVLGPCNGMVALSPALADIAVATRGVISEGEAATTQLLVEDDLHSLAIIRELLGFLPSSHRDTPPRRLTTDDASRADGALDTLVHASDQPYDMLDVITRIVDQDETGAGYLFQLHEHFACNMITGFARMNGRTVGIVANQPTVLAGALDSDASAKAARFVRFCNAFHIPLITFVDSPGLLNERDSIRHGAQLLCAFAEATVPKLTVIIRSAYGEAYGIMSSKHLGADLNLAWPTAEVIATAPGAAIDILYRRELASIIRHAEAIMPQGVTLSKEQKLEILTEARNEKVDEYREHFANPYIAAERGYIDAVIRPAETRHRLITALDRLSTRGDSNPPRKHDNIPL